MLQHSFVSGLSTCKQLEMDAKLEVTSQNSQQREASKKISKKKTIQGGDKKKETIDGKVKRKINEVTSDDQGVKKRRTGNFISDNEFKRLACQQPISWSSLSRERIYKLEWVNKADKQRQIAGNLTDSDGNTVSVLLPKFVVDRLLEIPESNVKIYVKPTGEDNVDIAILEKHLCKYCNKELKSRIFLQRHLERCTAVVKSHARFQKVIDEICS